MACIVCVILLLVAGWFSGERLKNKKANDNENLVECDTYDPSKSITKTTVGDDQMQDSKRAYCVRICIAVAIVVVVLSLLSLSAIGFDIDTRLFSWLSLLCL